jgi:predicted secreted protein
MADPQHARDRLHVRERIISLFNLLGELTRLRTDTRCAIVGGEQGWRRARNGSDVARERARHRRKVT